VQYYGQIWSYGHPLRRSGTINIESHDRQLWEINDHNLYDYIRYQNLLLHAFE